MPLIVKPISGMLIKDQDFLGKMDPYCIIEIGGEKQRTRNCNGGGKNPSWSETFQFSSTDPILRLQVWDSDTFSRDDLIGQGTLNLNQFYQNPMRTENEYIDILNKGRSAGRILLSIEYQGPPMGGGWGGNQGGWGPQGGYGPQGGNWGPQGGWGGNQGGWGGNQGGWGGNQGGWGGNQAGNQGGWGGNQGGWGGNQGGWGGNQGGWGGNRGGW